MLRVALSADCKSHMAPAVVLGRGLAAGLVHFKAALHLAAGRARIGTLLAEVDLDAECVYVFARDRKVCTLVPPERGQPSNKPLAGRWRRWMRRRFDKAKCGQRWLAESVNSMIKRRLGLALRMQTH